MIVSFREFSSDGGLSGCGSFQEKKRAVTKEIDGVESRIHLLKASDESQLSDSQRSLDDLGTEFQVRACSFRCAFMSGFATAVVSFSECIISFCDDGR